MTVTVLYIILAVVAVIAALLIFVLASPLFLRIRYVDGLEIFAGLSFVKLKVFPKAEKKNKKPKKKTRKKAGGSAEKSKINENVNTASEDNGRVKKTDGKKNSVKETLTLILEIVKSVLDTFGKRAEISIDLLKVIVSKPDAADTAIQFGLCGGIVSNILAFTSNFRKASINDENILVEPDFITGKSSLAVDVTVKISSFSLVSSFVKGYIKGISHK